MNTLFHTHHLQYTGIATGRIVVVFNIGIIMKEIQSLLGHLSKEIDRKEATLQNFEHHFGSAMQKANDVCHHLVQLNAHPALCKSLWQVNNVVRHICTKFFIRLMHFLYLWPGYIP